MELTQNAALRWIVEGQILAIQIQANTQDLMHIYDDQVLSCLDASSTPIDLIVLPPPNENRPPALRQLTSLKTLRHPQLGYVIMTRATGDPIVRFLMPVMAALAKIKIKGVDTLDDAVMFLRTIRNI